MFEITILNDLILYGGVLLSIPLIVVYVMCMSNEFVRTIYSQNLFFFSASDQDYAVIASMQELLRKMEGLYGPSKTLLDILAVFKL